jgi:hypothetical protein
MDKMAAGKTLLPECTQPERAACFSHALAQTPSFPPKGSLFLPSWWVGYGLGRRENVFSPSKAVYTLISLFSRGINSQSHCQGFSRTRNLVLLDLGYLAALVFLVFKASAYVVLKGEGCRNNSQDHQ